MAEPSGELETIHGVLRALYRVLGERAGDFSSDAIVVACYEASRALGELAMSLRALTGVTTEPPPVVYAVLEAAATDDSGAMSLYALSMVVGPRLLVTLRDVAAATPEGEVRAWLEHASDVVVRQIRRVGTSVAGLAPIEDEAWQVAARDLVTTLDEAGYGESFQSWG